MKPNMKSLVLGAAVVVAGISVMPAAAKADRWDRHDDRHDRDHGGWVNVDIHDHGTFERVPVIVDRPQQVWVEPVYRTVVDRVWVEPVYQATCEKVWREPVVQKRVDRVWVPERREIQEVHRGYGRVTREQVVIPGHYEDRAADVVVQPGHFEDVTKQVLVAEGHWQNVERQELIGAGHWETRVERVAVAPPPAHDGLRIDLRLPIHW